MLPGAPRRAGRRGRDRGDRPRIPLQRRLLRRLAAAAGDHPRPRPGPPRARDPAPGRHLHAARRRLPVARERPRQDGARAPPLVAGRRRGLRGVRPADGAHGPVHQAHPVASSRPTRAGSNPLEWLPGAARASASASCRDAPRHLHPGDDDERGRLPRPVVRDRSAEGDDVGLGHHRHLPGCSLPGHRLRAAAPLHGRDRRRVPRVGHPPRRHRRRQPGDRVGRPGPGRGDPHRGVRRPDRRQGRAGRSASRSSRARRSAPAPCSPAPTRGSPSSGWSSRACSTRTSWPTSAGTSSAARRARSTWRSSGLPDFTLPARHGRAPAGGDQLQPVGRLHGAGLRRRQVRPSSAGGRTST